MKKRFYLLTCLMLLSAAGFGSSASSLQRSAQPAGFATESHYLCVVSDEIYYIADPDALFGLDLNPPAPTKWNSLKDPVVDLVSVSPHRRVPHFVPPSLEGKFPSFLWRQCGACAVLSSRQFRSEFACTTRIHAAIGGVNQQRGSIALEFIQPVFLLPRDFVSNFGTHSPPSPL